MATLVETFFAQHYPSEETLQTREIFDVIKKNATTERTIKLTSLPTSKLALIDGSTGMLHTNMDNVKVQLDTYLAVEEKAARSRHKLEQLESGKSKKKKKRKQLTP